VPFPLVLIPQIPRTFEFLEEIFRLIDFLVKEYELERINTPKAISKFLTAVSEILDLPVPCLFEVLDPGFDFMTKNMPELALNVSDTEMANPGETLELFMDCIAQGVFSKK
jgi:hypothetical protein